MPEVVGAKQGSRYRSNHSVMLLSLKTETVKTDKPFWKFNISLLKDKLCVDEINTLLLRVQMQYSLPVYNIDNLDNVFDEYIRLIINDQLCFETLMMKIRAKPFHTVPLKKKQETVLEQSLLNEI